MAEEPRGMTREGHLGDSRVMPAPQKRGCRRMSPKSASDALAGLDFQP